MKIVSAFAVGLLGACMFAGGAAPIQAGGALKELAGDIGGATALDLVACRSVSRPVCVKGQGCRKTTKRVCAARARPVCHEIKSQSCSLQDGRPVCGVTTREYCG